jgi:hypothetical protein
MTLSRMNWHHPKAITVRIGVNNGGCKQERMECQETLERGLHTCMEDKLAEVSKSVS